MTPQTRSLPPHPPPSSSILAKRGSLGSKMMYNGKNIDVGGVKPLVNQREIHCARPGNFRSNAGKPSYKSQEEQYQEIQELRRNLGELREENSGLKTRSRRLEEDLLRRDRQIHQLMDPAKNDEARRQLTDKGASVVSSLKLRVSRLEATLRDKEAEVAKLRASAKATALHEMRVEAETYYQEVVRLRNQLNIVQQQQQQQHYHQHPPSPHSSSHPPPPPPPPPHTSHQPPPPPHTSHQPPPPPLSHHHHLHPTQPDPTATPTYHQGDRGGMSRAPRDGGDGQESPSADLCLALAQLEEENAILGQRVTTLTSEKDKLSTDLERVLGLTEDVMNSYEGVSRVELIREVERRQAEVVRWEDQHHQLTESLTARTDRQGEGPALLKAKVAELQGREVEWERERASLRELITTLKDDRLFYKETAEKKDSELDSLRHEVQSLQQEVSGLHQVTRRPLHHPTPRTAKPSPKTGPSSASRSGSSSEANTPIRRARPSSARPPPSGSRPQRLPKSSSEPREPPPQPSGKSHRTPTPQKPQTLVKLSSKQSGVVKSQGSKRTSQAPGSSRGSVVASPKHTGVVSRAVSSSSTSSKASTPSASPCKTSTSSASPQHRASQQKSSLQQRTSPMHRASPQQKPSSQNAPSQNRSSPQHRASPQHRGTSQHRGSPQHAQYQHSKSSPQHHKVSGPSQSSSSPAKSSSTSTTASPRKATTPNRSPTKVPQPRVTAGAGRRREESASPVCSPARTPKFPRKQKSNSVQNSSAELARISSPSTSPKLPSALAPPDIVLQKKEEDERVLAEILFHRETDSSGEASDYPHSTLERQRTITLAHSDVREKSLEGDSAPSNTQKDSQPSTPLLRQSTMTLSKEEDSQELGVNQRENEEENESADNGREEEAAAWKEEKRKSVLSSQDSEIIENLELLQSLLCSHLSRQRQVNELLNQDPLLVGEGQVVSEEGPPDMARGRGTSRRERRGARDEREAPDGEEAERGKGGQNQRSHSLVRQGTFNVYDEEGTTSVQATLDAHLTRITKVHQYSSK